MASLPIVGRGKRCDSCLWLSVAVCANQYAASYTASIHDVLISRRQGECAHQDRACRPQLSV